MTILESPEPEKQPKFLQMDFISLLWPLARAACGIAALIAIAVLLAIIDLHFEPLTYQATLLVTQADTQAKSGLGDLLGKQASSLLALRKSAPSGANDNFALYLDGLKTRAVAEKLMQDKHLVLALFGNQWDPTTNQWREPQKGAMGELTSTVFYVLGFPTRQWHPPSAETMATFLNNNVSVDVDPADPMVQIHITLEDPELAMELLEKLHLASDNYLKAGFLQRTESYTKYLTARLNGEINSDLRQALIDNLSEQERTHMMASSSLSFAAQKFGNAFTSDKPVTPRPVRTIGIAVALSFVLGSLLAFFEVRLFLSFDAAIRGAMKKFAGLFRRSRNRKELQATTTFKLEPGARGAVGHRSDRDSPTDRI